MPFYISDHQKELFTEGPAAIATIGTIVASSMLTGFISNNAEMKKSLKNTFEYLATRHHNKVTKVSFIPVGLPSTTHHDDWSKALTTFEIDFHTSRDIDGIIKDFNKSAKKEFNKRFVKHFYNQKITGVKRTGTHSIEIYIDMMQAE